MLLLLNIGNSNVQIAEYDGGTIKNMRAVSQDDFPGEMARCRGMDKAACCVVPERRREFAGDIGFFLGIEHGAAAGLDLTCVDVSTLGADRLANALALLPPQTGVAQVSFDFGTALNCEIVDADGVFRGGAILPGRKLMRRALALGTAQLPELELSAMAPEEPGIDTRTTMLYGLDRGIVGAVREIVNNIAVCYAPQRLRLVATGGDAPFFTAALPGIFAETDRELTLRGLLRGFLANN